MTSIQLRPDEAANRPGLAASSFGADVRGWRNLGLAALVFYGFFAGVGSIVELGYPDPLRGAVYNLATLLLSMVVALAISFTLDRRPASSWRRAWLFIILVSAGLALASEPFCWLMARAMSARAPFHPKLILLQSWTETFLLYLLWSLIHVFIRSGERAVSQERRIAAVRQALLEDEHEGLLYTLDPGFLTDVLEGVGREVGRGAHGAAGDTVIALAEHMRDALARRPEARRTGADLDGLADGKDVPVEIIDAGSFLAWTLLMWAGLLGVIVCIAAVRPGPGQLDLLVQFGPQPLVGALWCLSMQRRLDRRQDRPLRQLYAEGAGLCFAGLIVACAVLFASTWMVGMMNRPYVLVAIPSLEIYYMAPALAAWTAAYFIVDARRREIARLRGAAQVREAALKARNAMLRQQLNPHFLFNALNALYTLILAHETQRALLAVAAIGRFLDRAGAPAGGDFVPLSSELATQDAYLEIARVRFGDRLRVDQRVDRELASAQVPHLILQPLVENAIKYGVSRTDRPVVVEIRAERIGGELVLQVRDSGAPGAALRPPGLGVGLENVQGRLHGLYGEAGRLVCTRLEPAGFVAEVRMPLVM